jgi:alkylation response protein AidB-like acyl-CoA dehydrogenase
MVRQLEDNESNHSPELWHGIGSRGWLKTIVPERYGGIGSSFLDTCAIYEEMGRALTPGPFLDVVLSESLLLDLAFEAHKAELMPRLAEGSLIATVAYTEPSASYDPASIRLTAEADGDGFKLNGQKLFVTNADLADKLFVVARTRATAGTAGLSVFLVDRDTPGVTVTRMRTLVADGQCDVVLNDVSVPASRLLGPKDEAWPALARYLSVAQVMTCVWSIGGAERVLEMTTEYAKDRVQFGRPIGTFQAISHKCADMAIALDGMRFVAYHAAWKLAQGLPAEHETAIAKTWAADAYRQIAETGHQVFGGVGYTMRHDMQMYFRRAKAAEVAFGDSDYHRERVAQGLGL